MTAIIQGDQTRTLVLGSQVNRATAALPQTATGGLFTVSGGRILLTSIVGEVTTVIQTQANNTQLVATPTVGVVAPLCAVLDITARAVGVLLTVSGLVSDALIASGATTITGAVSGQVRPLIVAAGVIGLSCAASNTGAIKWSMTYVAIDNGASVAAV